MPAITDRLATVEAAVRSITSGGSVSTVIIDSGGNTVELEAMDDQQNARLASAEAGIASLGSTVSTQAATIADQATTIAQLQADLADALDRIALLEATLNATSVFPSAATATGAAYAASVSTVPPFTLAYAGSAVASGTAYNGSVAGPAEGTSTTYALPFRLAT